MDNLKVTAGEYEGDELTEEQVRAQTSPKDWKLLAERASLVDGIVSSRMDIDELVDELLGTLLKLAQDPLFQAMLVNQPGDLVPAYSAYREIVIAAEALSTRIDDAHKEYAALLTNSLVCVNGTPEQPEK